MSSSGNAEEAEMKVITLISSDNARFDVVEAVALQSETLKHLIEDGCACEFIPMPGVILSMVLKYCNRLAGVVPDAPKLDDEEALKAFRTDFVQDLDLDTLFQLVSAANYLCIKSLQYLISQTIVDMTKDNTLLQCRSDSVTSGKVMVVSSSDGVIFEVEEAVAFQCETLKHMIEDDCAAGIIPLPNVTSGIMSKVIEYCKRRVSIWEADKEHKKKKLANEFVGLDQKTLFDLVMAADYLEIKGLLDLLCDRVAEMMRGKTPQQIRETFHIKNDFTKEEEDEVRRENSWALE